MLRLTLLVWFAMAATLSAQITGSGGIFYGATIPATCSQGDVFASYTAGTISICTSANTWSSLATAAQAKLPTGMITLIASGACPTGFSEASALNGVMLRGTLAANGNVGTTGGSDSITPTVASLTAAAQVFSGSSATTSAVSAGTPAGTNGTVNFTPVGTVAWPAGVPTFTGGAGTIPAQTITWPVGVPTFAGSALAAHAHELPWQIPSTTTIRQIAVATFGTGTSRAATAVSAAGTANTTSAAVALSQAVTAGTPAGTIAWPAGVPTNSTVAFTPAGTVAWPAGVPTLTGTQGVVPAQAFNGSALGTHQHTLTATGTNGTSAVTGTLNSFDNRPSYLNVIFCQAN